jgi:hypothetical protein
MDKKTKGAWLVHHTNKLQKVDNQANYENIFLAGKAGILLSAISSTNQSSIDNNKLTTLAQASNINTRLELPELLHILQEHGLLIQGTSGIDVLGITGSATLQHVADIFDNTSPSPIENASLELSEKSSFKPQERNEISTDLSDTFKIDTQNVSLLLDEAENIGFVDSENIDTNKKLYFNGNLFRRDETVKINAVLSSLSADEQMKLTAFSTMLSSYACLSVEEAKLFLGDKLFEKVSAIGLFDINVVSNSSEEIGYVTKPSAFSKYSSSMVEDAFDLAKAFVASLTYGMTRSEYTRGKITMISKLLGALINGDWVGPVDAIGQDYKVLELKHVVEVAHGPRKGRIGYNMRLLKKEVGELALTAIQNGDVSDQSLKLPGASVNRFEGPEHNREKARRKQLKQSPKSTTDMLMALRTGVKI